jgi:1,4-alpha-glucan branching enzyme
VRDHVAQFGKSDRSEQGGVVLSQQNISAATPNGATLVEGGATFRVWAPRATAVYLNGNFGGAVYHQQTEDRLLSKDMTGYWTGFQPGAQDGDQYRFWVAGTGSSGYKRDPYARELAEAGFPNCSSILRASDAYPWHDSGFRSPDFSDTVIYQAHIGTYAISTPGVASNLLDVAGKVPYLAALGVNVLQPLPIDEQEANPSMGYGGADLFSPDFPYVAGTASLPNYLAVINDLLAAKQLEPLKLEHIQSGPCQLKALVDLCHLYGIAVAFDVVYNHAGGFSVNGQLDDNCLYYFDRLADAANNNDSLYFTDQDRGTGGLALAMWNEDVCRLLQDNAEYYIKEFHADGFRYDEVSILLSTNQANGWQFCRDLTTALRTLQPRVLQNAEFWPGEFSDIPSSVQPVISPAAVGGAGFDVVQHDALRSALRDAVAAASGGARAMVSVSAVAAALYPSGLDHAWRAVTCVENHDLVMAGRSPRIAALADGSNHRSWYARSRSRFATALLLTAPGIPQLFMGQEFLEDKPWNTVPNGPDLLWWAGLNSGSDKAMVDHLRFTQDVIHLRASQPALRGDNVHPYYVSDSDRVLAVHRWVEGTGQDVIVIATLAEATWWGYQLGFPSGGLWREVFNSDVYDNWVNPWVAGNGEGVYANGGPMHGFVASGSVVIPANGVVVFAKA